MSSVWLVWKQGDYEEGDLLWGTFASGEHATRFVELLRAADPVGSYWEEEEAVSTEVPIVGMKWGVFELTSSVGLASHEGRLLRTPAARAIAKDLIQPGGAERYVARRIEAGGLSSRVVVDGPVGAGVVVMREQPGKLLVAEGSDRDAVIEVWVERVRGLAQAYLAAG